MLIDDRRPLLEAQRLSLSAVSTRVLVADLLDKPEVDHVAMILDAKEVTFRNKIYDKYKANRPPPPEDLVPQFPLIREAAKAFNVTVCELDGY